MNREMYIVITIHSLIQKSASIYKIFYLYFRHFLKRGGSWLGRMGYRKDPFPPPSLKHYRPTSVEVREER